MSHTNTTANYNLPQFVGTDKPSWLTDVNGAMTSIDTQMKANADANTTTAGDLTTLAGRVTTAEQNITTQGSTLQTVSNVASSASTKATNALNVANTISDFIDVKRYNALTGTITTGSATITQNAFYEAVNEDGSYGKFYGTMLLIPTSANGCTITIPSSFRPQTTTNIDGLLLFEDFTSGNAFNFITPAFNANGDIVITLSSAFYNHNIRLLAFGVPLYMKDFGDIVNPGA